jgi:hypothetical protein
MSYAKLHAINDRATQFQMMGYKHALLLFKIFNENTASPDWIQLNFTQIQSRRQKFFECISDSNFKIGKSIISNRLSMLNKKIPLSWLNKSFEAYKIDCKKIIAVKPC